MKRRCLPFSIAFFLALVLPSTAHPSCRDIDVVRGLAAPAYAAEPDALIEYFGHNFFQITTSKGTKIVTDPLAPGMHPTPNLTPHVVTIGREHPNHNAVDIIGGKPLVLRGLAYHGAEWNRVSTQVRDVYIYNIPIYQNGLDGALKGAAFVFDLGTLCVAHLGDLSHLLTPQQLKQLGRVDIAFVPIGGVFTMPARAARQVMKQLKPKIAIPMHYRDNSIILESFLSGLPARRQEGHTLTVSKSALPSATEIVVLRPWAGRGYQ